MGTKIVATLRKSAAFTIIELLIVIVVIAILAALLLFGYSAVVNNANNTSLKDDLSKLGDTIQLNGLDNQVIPSGGATSSNGGDSTRVDGVVLKPNTTVYDLTVSNLYYCNGIINDTNEFTLIARGKSGKAFSISSKDGIKDFPAYAWSANNSGVAICQLAGYSAPFTWAYGYSPSVQYKWFPWANGNASTITNIGLNPRNDTAIWSNNNTATWTVTAATVTGNPSGITTATKSQLKVGQTHTQALSLYNVDGLLNSSTPRSIGIWAYVNTSGYEAFFIGPTETAHVALAPSTWTYVKSTTALTGYVGFYIQKTSGNADPNDVAYATGSMTVAGSQAYDYRDGNSVGWTWSGTPGASTSSGPSPN